MVCYFTIQLSFYGHITTLPLQNYFLSFMFVWWCWWTNSPWMRENVSTGFYHPWQFIFNLFRYIQYKNKTDTHHRQKENEHPYTKIAQYKMERKMLSPAHYYHYHVNNFMNIQFLEGYCASVIQTLTTNTNTNTNNNVNTTTKYYVSQN